MDNRNDVLDTLLNAAADIKAIQPQRQFVIIHPDDFPDFRSELESEGMIATPQHGTNVWDFCLGEGLLGGVVMRAAVSDHAIKGQAMVMPLPDQMPSPLSTPPF